MPEKRSIFGRTPSAAVVALVLVIFALSGLGAGVLSRTALTGLGVLRAATATTTILPTATTTIGSASPSPSVALTATLPPKGFTLRATVTPNTFTVGQSFTISVAALAADGVSPAVGVPVYLQAPSGDTNPLFTPWPAPQVTAADGTAQWSLTAPTATTGAYTLEVIATGQSDWTYRFDISVTLEG